MSVIIALYSLKHKKLVLFSSARQLLLLIKVLQNTTWAELISNKEILLLLCSNNKPGIVPAEVAFSRSRHSRS